MAGERSSGVGGLKRRAARELESRVPGLLTSTLDSADPELPVPRELINTDITGQMVLLGTGTSVGVPVIGCGCDVCRSANPQESPHAVQRDPGAAGRQSADRHLARPARSSCCASEIGLVHAVLYTHEHADHIFGLDDLRLMQFYLGGPVPLYCEERGRSSGFASRTTTPSAAKPILHAGAVPQLVFRRITTEPFDVLGARDHAGAACSTGRGSTCWAFASATSPTAPT